MLSSLRTLGALCAGWLALGAASASAQDRHPHHADPDHHPVVFVEATGAYGFQLGETPYLPSGMPGDYQHPMVHGFGVGGTLGFNLSRHIAVIANYEYANSRSSHGSIAGIVDDLQVSLDYHTIVAGMRLSVPCGFGAFHAEFAGGILLPFETRVDVDYGPGLAGLPTPITGSGSMIDSYSIGVGGHGLIGYRMPLFGPLYLGVNVKLRAFQSENAGERTRLNNYITDYGAPSATTAEIRHGDGAAAPNTTSVQDLRLQLAIGAEF